MNTQELLKALQEAGRSDVEILVVPFVKQGSGPGGTATYIMNENDRWVVGSYERGVWTPENSFDTEDDACQSIYEFYTRPMPEPSTLTPEEWEEGRRITWEHVAETERMLAERFRKAQEGDESHG